MPVLMLILSTMFYVYFINSFDNLGITNIRFLNILRKYDDLPENSFIFLGDSQVQEGIDCLIIDSDNLNCFNFGLLGMLPLQLALQKNLIIFTNPKLVFFGISPLFFNEDINKNDDIYFLMNDWKGISLDKSILNLLNDKEKEILFKGDFAKLLYKRKFILPFYINFIKSLVSPEEEARQIENNFKNPYYYTEDQNLEELIEKLENSDIIDLFEINKSSARQKEAFEYLIKSLHESDIDVVIIQMPLNPLLRDKLHKGSMEQYYNHLSELAYKYDLDLINLEEVFDEESSFTDLTHLNEEGRKRLALNISKGDYNII